MAAGAGPACGCGLSGRCGRRRLLLLTDREQVCRVGAGVCRHAVTHEAGHCACLVVGCRDHGVRLRSGNGRRGVVGILEHSRALCLLDQLLILLREGDGAESNVHDLDAAELAPLCGEGLVHCGFKLGVVVDDLVRAELHIGELAESGLERADELGLELSVDHVAGVVARDVAAYVRVEQERVGDLVGIHAGAAEGNVEIEVDLGIDNAEGDGVRSAELIVDDLLQVEVIDPLILAGIAAVGEPLADLLEQVEDALAEAAGEDAGLKGGVVDEAAGLRANLADLAVFNDDHALTICDVDLGAVGDDVVIALGVGGAAGDDLGALPDEHVPVHCFAIEKLFPLVGKNAACCAY